MSELLLMLSGLVLVATVVGVVLLGRDRLSGWTAPARDGIVAERAPGAPLVLPERLTAADVERIALFLDMDGVLAPMAPTPEAVVNWASQKKMKNFLNSRPGLIVLSYSAVSR